MEQTASIILTREDIGRRLRRMAWEIYERNAEAKELVLVGIRDRGQVVAEKLKEILEKIAPFEIRYAELELDKLQPGEVTISPEMDFTGRSVILIDDVANTGRTLLYAMKPFLETLPSDIQTAVLVDRTHKTFPVVANYIGHSLSTTLQDNIRVKVEGKEITAAYLC